MLVLFIVPFSSLAPQSSLFYAFWQCTLAPRKRSVLPFIAAPKVGLQCNTEEERILRRKTRIAEGPDLRVIRPLVKCDFVKIWKHGGQTLKWFNPIIRLFQSRIYCRISKNPHYSRSRCDGPLFSMADDNKKDF